MRFLRVVAVQLHLFRVHVPVGADEYGFDVFILDGPVIVNVQLNYHSCIIYDVPFKIKFVSFTNVVLLCKS